MLEDVKRVLTRAEVRRRKALGLAEMAMEPPFTLHSFPEDVLSTEAKMKMASPANRSPTLFSIHSRPFFVPGPTPAVKGVFDRNLSPSQEFRHVENDPTMRMEMQTTLPNISIINNTLEAFSNAPHLPDKMNQILFESNEPVGTRGRTTYFGDGSSVKLLKNKSVISYAKRRDGREVRALYPEPENCNIVSFFDDSKVISEYLLNMLFKVEPGCLRCRKKSKALFVCHRSMEPGRSRKCENCWLDGQGCSLSLSRGLWADLHVLDVGDAPEAPHLDGSMSLVVKMAEGPIIQPHSKVDIIEMRSALKKRPRAMQLLDLQSEEKPEGPKKRTRLGKRLCHLAGLSTISTRTKLSHPAPVNSSLRLESRILSNVLEPSSSSHRPSLRATEFHVPITRSEHGK